MPELFDICIKEGYAENLQLNITTNGTKFIQDPRKNKKFKDVYLNTGCDGYGKCMITLDIHLNGISLPNDPMI